MLQQPENEDLTPQEQREALLAEVEARRPVLAELSEEHLQQITGGCLKCTSIDTAILANSAESERYRRLAQDAAETGNHSDISSYANMANHYTEVMYRLQSLREEIGRSHGRRNGNEPPNKRPRLQ